MPIFCDVETDGLEPTKIHVVVCKYKGKVHRFFNKKDFLKFKKEHNKIPWVFHNGINYDVPKALWDLWFINFKPELVLDTMVISKTLNYSKFQTHSLKELGEFLGVHKGDFDGPWDKCTDEMVEYCEQDVEVTEAIWNYYLKQIQDKDWSDALRLEHDTAGFCYQLNQNGFEFDLVKAAMLLVDILKDLEELEDDFKAHLPKTRKKVKELKYKVTKSGGPTAAINRAYEEYPDNVLVTKPDGDILECYEEQEFNPGSPKQRVEKLWEAGWKPFEKTKGHQKNKDPDKKEQFEYYGWTCSEANLSTLPDSAPQAYKNLAKWLTLEGRRSSLVEWIECVSEDGRVHGKFWHIGAWTQRMSHSNPNSANISSVWPKGVVPATAVEEVKAKYDTELRSLFTVPSGKKLVGVDAEGIQLRVLAHYMNDKDYTDAVVSGDKDKGTDVHTMNMKALGVICKDRDTAKTFIYAWLLGAGMGKIASILNCSIPQASQAVKNFLDAYPGLKRLKGIKIPSDALRGYFVGLDGRKVQCDSEHFMLAGYLQNGESVIMKRAARIFIRDTTLSQADYKFVNFVHDEFQVECSGHSEAKVVLKELSDAIRQAGEELNLNCPMAGSGSIGINWAETH